MSLRRFVEVFCRNRSYWRHLPEEFGGRFLMVSPDAALRWLKPGAACLDAKLMSLLTFVKPGMPVWDIGASVGEFALTAAALSRSPVLAVEPDPFLVRLLGATKAANYDLDLAVLEAAVADHERGSELQLNAGGRNGNSLAGDIGQTRAARGSVPVRTVTLDALLERHFEPQLVKIDVEGAELAALAGGRRLLEQVRPIWIIETCAATDAAVRRIFTETDYILKHRGDYVAVPAERSPGVSPAKAAA